MKNLTLKLAATLFIFSGCAQNDLIDSPDQGTSNDGKIRFAATSALTGTRAADGNPFNNTQGLQALGAFYIDGYYKDASIYAGTAQNVKWNGGSWEYTNEPYWPTGDDVKINFFAYANWEKTGATLAFAKEGITATGTITVGEDKLDGTGQRDLLVGGQMGATKQSRTLITFKHALTQVVFKAANVNKDRLDVRIGGVRIVNVDSTASKMAFDGTDITWTLSGTADGIYHVQGLETETNWATIDASGKTTININNSKVYTAPTEAIFGDYSTYTVIQKTDGEKNNALLLLPQTFTAWNPNNAAGAGSYIELLAVVKDPANTANLQTAKNQEEVDALKPYYYSGTPNFVGENANTESYGIIRIPVSSAIGDLGEWKAGKRITYLITFGDSGSGSGGGGYNPGGDEILTTIRFNAIVENWVDVNIPLLTATFNASSGSVDGTFIDGYTNQMINDITSARLPKVYKSSINVTGQLSQTSTNQKITLSGLNNNKILVGSTVTYNFTGIDVWGKTLTIDALPANWSAKYYKDNTKAEAEVTSDPKSLNGAIANIVVLTKDSEIDANMTYSSVAPEYISDFISAIRINEGTTVRANEWKIKVTGTIAKNITFSADELTLLGGTATTSKVTVDLSGATFSEDGNGKLSVIVPAGWKATWDSNTTKYVGETLEATAKTSNITFIKL